MLYEEGGRGCGFSTVNSFFVHNTSDGRVAFLHVLEIISQNEDEVRMVGTYDLDLAL